MFKLNPYAILQGDSTTGVYTDAYFHHVPFQQIEQFRSAHSSLITLLKQVDVPHRPRSGIPLGVTPVQPGALPSEDAV